MPRPPSRRELLAFARSISPHPGVYLCPRCIRLARTSQNEASPSKLGGVRWFSGTASRLSDEFDALCLSNREASKDTSTSKVPEALGEQGVTSVEQLETALEISEIKIEELEDALMESHTASTEGNIKVPGTVEEDANRPWYMREEGDITEEEYAEIEQLLNSQSELDAMAAHRPFPPAPPAPQQQQGQELERERIPQPEEVVPWYLREQEFDNSLIPQIELQQTREEKYPDIPYNAPPLLQPLISRLFYDHHLQDIVILDLRGRDPPPVWGQNTIMILATVRAERQLRSVSEATSKWLKSTAGVIPRVDGLPKRESLVIQRRRLRRKSLRRPGYLITPPKSTSWVSMYTGYQGLVLQLFTAEGREEYDLEGLWGDNRVIDAGALDMKPRKIRRGGIEEDEPVETWRPSQNQKKPDWQRKLEKEQKKREKKKEEKASKKRRWTKLEKEQARSRRGQIESGSVWEMPSIPRSSFGFQARGDFQQRREYHATARRLAAQMDDSQVLEKMVDASQLRPSRWKKSRTPFKKQAAWWGSKSDKLPNLGDTVLPSSVYEQIIDTLRNQPPFSTRDSTMDRLAKSVAVQGDRTFAETLSNLRASNDPNSLLLLAHFGNLSRFIKATQSSPDIGARKLEFSMPPHPEKGFQWAFDFFLRDMPIRPNGHHWQLAILYYINLQTFDHEQYSMRRLLDLLLLPVSQGITIPRSTFHLILNHIAISSPEHRDDEKEAQDGGVFFVNAHKRLYLMDPFIKAMKAQFGYDYTRDEEVYLALYKACCQPYQTIPELVASIDQPLPRHHNDYRRILIKYYLEKKLPASPEFFVLELMQFAHMHFWRSFLKRWNWAQAAGIGKDADTWAMFWCSIARGRHEWVIRKALRENYEEMMNEGNHLVLNRSIAIGLSKCIDLVDPEGEEFAVQRKVSNRMLETLV